MTNHLVSLTGSYPTGNTEKLFKHLPHDGILQFSFIGREVTLNVKSEQLEDVKKALKKVGVENLEILEWRKSGVTLSGSGAGGDDEKIMRVSLIPSVNDEGIKNLAVLTEHALSDKIIQDIEDEVKTILEDSKVTDALFTVQVMKKASPVEYGRAAQVATLNALFEAGGIINVE